MLLTIATTHSPAVDLGYLLHKNPARVHETQLSFGTALMFYPELTEHRATFALALDMQEADTSPAARVIVLISDGAAVIDRKVQEQLRAAFARRPINLYWLFLRTEGTPGISTVPAPGLGV